MARNFDVSGWRNDAEPDGWKWTDPKWDQRVSKESILALVVEALRRGIDLRDASAESGEGDGLTSRALFLVSVLNALYERAVADRAKAMSLAVDAPNGTGAEIVEQLLQAGILTPKEYRPCD